MTTFAAPPRTRPSDTRQSVTVARPQRRRRATVFVPALASLLLLSETGGALAAGALAISVLMVPGSFVVGAARTRGPTERLVVTMVVSLTFWMLVAHVLLSLQWWEPRLTAGVLLGAAALFAVVPSGTPAGRSIRATGRDLVDHVGTTQLAWSGAALGLWLVSLPFIDAANIGDWGLVASVPPMFFLAYAIAIVVPVVAALAPRTSPRRVAIGLIPLLMITYATMASLVGTIRYPWAYKHVGVIRLLDETGRFHPGVDIYNNFSGFFGLGAFVRGATGVDPTSYAAWSQLVASALILMTVWLLVRRATDSERVAHLAAVMYLLTDWVGQNYFAAQTVATFLSLGVLGLSMSWFLGGATRPLRFMSARIDGIAPTSGEAIDRNTENTRRVIVLFAFLGVMMTHPLTPFATIGVLTLAFVVGWLRDGKLIAGLFIVVLAWAIRSIAYFAAQDFDLGFGGSPTANADGNLDYSDAPAVVALVGDLTRLFSVGVWATAVVGALLCAWAMRRTGMLLLAALIPFGIPLVQSYGGEVIYRVYLYSLPLMVGLAAWGIVTTTPIVRRSRFPQPTILAAFVCLCFGAGFLVAHFGRERINTVSASEVAMGDYINENIPDPAVLAQLDGTYPAASGARYPSFQVNDTYVPMITDLVVAQGRLPTVAELDEAADDLIALESGTPYVIVSPGMIDSIEQIASLPVHSTSEAVALLTMSDRYIVRHRIDDSWLLEVTP